MQLLQTFDQLCPPTSLLSQALSIQQPECPLRRASPSLASTHLCGHTEHTHINQCVGLKVKQASWGTCSHQSRMLWKHHTTLRHPCFTDTNLLAQLEKTLSKILRSQPLIRPTCFHLFVLEVLFCSGIHQTRSSQEDTRGTLLTSKDGWRKK